MSSLPIAHRSGRTMNKTGFMATDGIGVQTCYRRACGSAAGHWDSGNSALAVSLRRCRAASYTSSDAPRFTDMRLFPFPFGSRSVVRLGVMCPELRPSLVAIHSVRDTAHGFPAPGSSGGLASAIRPKCPKLPTSLSPARRLTLSLRPSMSGQCCLCRLRLPVGPFPMRPA
jgi:hypothetical protein